MNTPLFDTPGAPARTAHGLLDEARSERALALLDATVVRWSERLSSGDGSVPPWHAIEASLLLSHVAAGRGDEGLAALAWRAFRRAAPQVEQRAWLFGGVTGLALAGLLLERQSGRSFGANFHASIEAALLDDLATWPDEGVDLLRGVSGVMTYALARWPHDGAVKLLRRSIELLDARATRGGDGVTWATQVERCSPELLAVAGPAAVDGGVVRDLGVAHGVAALAPLLASAGARGVERVRADALLEGLVEWLMRQRLTGGEAFAYLAGSPVRARPAWCYGEVGIAMALAVSAIDGPRWIGRLAEDIAVDAARRPARPAPATLCHGASGLALVFSRLHALLGRDELRVAARVWFDAVLAASTPLDPDVSGDALDVGRRTAGAGLVDRTTETEGRCESLLLEGDVGVALCVATLGGVAPAGWARFLLCSCEPIDAVASPPA